MVTVELKQDRSQTMPRPAASKPTQISAQTLIQKALIYQNQGKRREAIVYYQKAIALNPNQVSAYINLGSLFVEQERLEEAMAVVQKARVRWPENATIHNNLAYIYFKQGEIEQAIAGYFKAIELQPDLITAYQNLGRAFQHQKLHRAAVKSFQQVLQLKPNSILTHSHCSWSLLEEGKISEALEHWKQIVVLENFLIEAYCQQAEQLKNNDELDCARIACGKFLRGLQHPDISPEVYQNLAEIHLHLGNAALAYRSYIVAEYHYKFAIQVQPNFIEAYVQLTQCFVDKKDFDNAVNFYQKILPIKPDDLKTKKTLIRLLQYQYNSQIQAPKKPIQLNPVRLPNNTPNADPSLPKCQGLDCQPCLKRIINEFQPLHLGEGIYQTFQPPKIQQESTQTFVKVVNQGKAWIAPQKNWWNVCNSIAIRHSNDELIPEVSHFYPAPLPGCLNSDLHQHQVLSLEKLPPVKQIQGKVAVLSALSGNVYFHWMFDLLPRVEILRQKGINLEEIDYFICNQIKSQFQRETLQKLGVPFSKIIESDHHPHIQAQQLIVPSYPATVGWPNPFSIRFLRKLFLSSVNPTLDSNSPRRIYISRKKAKYRRIFNEDKVMEMLSKLGFVLVELESLSVQQQAHLFSQADVIISAHGSGLTNTVFCQPGTTVIELMSPHYIRHYFWVISQHLRLNHYYLTGEVFRGYPLRQLMYQNSLMEDIWVNLKALEKILQIVGIIKDTPKIQPLNFGGRVTSVQLKM